MRRATQGSLGAGAMLLVLLKLRLRRLYRLSSGLRPLSVSASFGRLFGLVLLTVADLVVALATCERDCAGDCDCERKEKRWSRLDGLMAERRTWLVIRNGPAPSLHRDTRRGLGTDRRRCA